MKCRLILTVLLLTALTSLSARDQEGRLLRFPAVGNGVIAFSYAGDLYTVPLEGGNATRITSHIGYEVFPKFSPDGRTIAFTGQYDGNTEVYTIPAEGGEPLRLTYTAALDRDNIGDRMGPNNIVMGWTPDGQNIVLRSRWYSFSGMRAHLFTVPAEGGELSQIPTTEGGFCSFSPDGQYLALNRMFREFRTWKYYKGGQADDIWVNKLGTTQMENITAGEGDNAQDIFPMWIGADIYFISDRDSIMNLFRYNTGTKKTEKITRFDTYDIKFPAAGGDYITFENGGYVYLFHTKTGDLKKVDIRLNEENLNARTRLLDVAGQAAWYSLSPNGEQVLVTARGDVFSVPGTEGATYNLTRTPGVHEREACWSPDGSRIAWFSDQTGEYQLYVMPYDKSSEARKITSFTDGYPDNLSWAPDSKALYFTTEKRELWCANPETGTSRKILQTPFSTIRNYDISPDGKWITYATQAENRMSVVYLYSVDDNISYPVTSPWYDAQSGVFSDDGKYLFFTSARDFRANYSWVEWNATYNVSSYIFVLPLAKDTPDPTALKAVEYKPSEKSEIPAAPAAGQKGRKNDKAEPAVKKQITVTVDLDGIVERASALPLEPGTYQILAAVDGDLYFMTRREVKKISLSDLKESAVITGMPLAYAPKGKKMLLRDGDDLFVIGAPTWKKDKKVSMGDVRIFADYPAEWNQIFQETWRVYRDHFYLPTMHGRDWNGIREKYEALLPYVKHRHDLTYVIGEMISELNVGHCYVTSPSDTPAAERVKVGLLGARFSKDPSGAFRVVKIYEGENWDKSLRSPFHEGGVDISQGDYILEVDGVDCTPMKVIYEALVGKVDKTVALTVNSTPAKTGARTVYVKPIADEAPLVYYEWVQENINKVNRASNGQIGYIHIPDMGIAGLDMFTKLFYSQLDKKALIIDDRMNGGGNVSPIILERLAREAYRMSMYRNGMNLPVPNESHSGPKVCLIDKYSMSDGDLFPYGFRKMGLGKLIGTRTWGGIVGISGSKPYLDGQDVRTPFFTSYSTDGEWIIEGYGVEPDIEVDINPFEDYLGNDAQLNKAIEVLLEELKSYEPLPGTPPDRKM
ncbi:MAG TPA: PDZ domain-containing protein [Bacteroidales bacterium]|nr:PDZ domain-containing protein [Bacteroidales bacterium]